MNLSRRNFLSGSATPAPVRPPWSDEVSVMRECTGCGDCATACPTGIIAAGNGGLPQIDFGRGECTFCGACARSCVADVFDLGRAAPFGYMAAISEKCLSLAGIECRACEDACPEAAIRFRPRIGLPPAPDIDHSRCSGCGACVAPCPADAVAMSRPNGKTVHA